MKFTEKNNFIVKNKSERFFDKDLELFKANCPNSTLHSNLKRVNSFNRSILDGKMLYELLDKVSPEEILNNRTDKPAEQIIETVEQAINIIKEVDPEFLPDHLDKNALDAIAKEAIGKYADAFRSMVSELLVAAAPVTTIKTIDEVKEILTEAELEVENIAEEFLLFLIGKTKEEILNIIQLGKQVNPSVIVDMNVGNETSKETVPEDLNEDVPSETVTSTDLSSGVQPPAETITEGKPEAVKTSKKKEVNKKSSRK